MCVGLRELGGHWGKGQKKIFGILFYILFSQSLQRPGTTVLIIGEIGTLPQIPKRVPIRIYCTHSDHLLGCYEECSELTEACRA